MIGEALAHIAQRPGEFLDALGTHIALSAAALAIGIALAVPLGLVLSRRPIGALVAINGGNLAKTVPSLAVLALMMPILGTGFVPALVALVLLALPPVLINTIVALTRVDVDVTDAARAMGMTPRQAVRRVELPLALPMVFAGIRIAAVEVVASATLASFIGGGGLGDFITAGIALSEMSQLLVGAVPVALLTVATELGFSLLQRSMTPAGLKSGGLWAAAA
ncbi:MAG: ABC transporter permease [Alphaproteobacteria bacterium]|nr:ABC transporter permease [Alphaproteobacteria bacterium]